MMTIPKTLKNFHNFVGVETSHAIIKRPVSPKTGNYADIHDPSTWGSYEEAMKLYDQGFDLGIITGQAEENAPAVFSITLKDVPEDIEEEFIETLETYAQTAKDGSIEFLCISDGNIFKNVGWEKKAEIKGGTATMSEKGKLFVFSDDIYNPNLTDTRDCTEEIKQLHHKHFVEDSVDIVSALFDYEKPQLKDDEVIKLAADPMAQNGTKFAKLFAGEYEDLKLTKEEADREFCGILSYWTGKNKFQIDQIYRQSALYDETDWERIEPTTGKSYGERTVQLGVQFAERLTEQMEETDMSLVYKALEVQEQGQKTTIDSVYERNDSGNAQRFFDKYWKVVHYCGTTKQWYVYETEKGTWTEDRTGLIKCMADDICHEIKKEAENIIGTKEKEDAMKFAIRCGNAKEKNNMIKEAQHLGTVPIPTPEVFDQDDMLINARNGVIDLKTGELLPHDAKYMMSNVLDVEYIPEDTREPELWKKCLDDWFSGDQEAIDYAQKMIGYSMTGMTTEQCLFFLYGLGNNGKSTILQVIAEILGGYAANAQPDTFSEKKMQNSSGPSSDIARLRGKRFVYTEESSDSVKLAEGLVKQLTGSSKITARFLNQNEFEYTPKFKIWEATNYKPIIHGTDVGIWRRIRLFCFRNAVSKDKLDKLLVYKLRKEYPLILKWMVEGCVRWIKDGGMEKGTDMPEVVEREVSQYRQDMDIILQFVEECININPTPEEMDGRHEKISIHDVFRAYKNWSKEGNEFLFKKNKFSREIQKYIPNAHRGSKNALYFHGVTWTDYGLSFVSGANFEGFNG